MAALRFSAVATMFPALQRRPHNLGAVYSLASPLKATRNMEAYQLTLALRKDY